ncbi:hypothetical protein Ciccas_010362 [Cichlidogyrus casuarinus]|uniref:Protoporphyrinogen oxidase n=1 Tax=Cichlidogyrus casuarinus TaxID=1844966 RepID=A0ABD2PVY8_9PLAT
MPNIAVLGGGLSGLTSALVLSRKLPSARIQLYESSDRFGGWIHSISPDKGHGSVFDLGPHSGRIGTPTSSASLELMGSLEMKKGDMLWLKKTSPAAKRYIYWRNDLVPVKFISTQKQQPFTRSPLQAIFKALFKKNKKLSSKEDDLSVDEFLRTRLDAEFADFLGSALMRGIFAGDSRKLSIRAALPLMSEIDSRKGNFILNAAKELLWPKKTSQDLQIDQVLKALFPETKCIKPPRGSFAWGFPRGMQTLTDAIFQELAQNANVELIPSCSVERVSSGSKLSVYLKGRNEAQNFDAVFSSLPSHNYKNFLPNSVLENLEEDGRKLTQMDWANVGICVVQLSGKIKLKKPAFGHLVPREEDDTILGVIYDSVAFPQLDDPEKKTTRFTVMMDGNKFIKREIGANKTLIAEAACLALKNHLSIDCFHEHPPVCIHTDVLFNCIPQYPVYHCNHVESLRKTINEHAPNFYVSGLSYDGVSVNDVIFSSMNQVYSFMNK